MTIHPVENTKQIPGRGPHIAIQQADEERAIIELEAIAARRGVRLGRIYKWGAGYYYAEIQEER